MTQNRHHGTDRSIQSCDPGPGGHLRWVFMPSVTGVLGWGMRNTEEFDVSKSRCLMRLIENFDPRRRAGVPCIVLRSLILLIGRWLLCFFLTKSAPGSNTQ